MIGDRAAGRARLGQRGYQPETVIVGLAAAIFLASEGCWQPATIAESKEFLDAYLRAGSGPWAQDDIQAFWAATVWTRAGAAKKESAHGSVMSLSQAEALDASPPLAHDSTRPARVV